MTVLKWLLIVVSVGYICGLAVLCFMQRSMLFLILTVAQTTPEDAGFRETEARILTTTNGENVIVSGMSQEDRAVRRRFTFPVVVDGNIGSPTKSAKNGCCPN